MTRILRRPHPISRCGGPSNHATIDAASRIELILEERTRRIFFASAKRIFAGRAASPPGNALPTEMSAAFPMKSARSSQPLSTAPGKSRCWTFSVALWFLRRYPPPKPGGVFFGASRRCVGFFGDCGVRRNFPSERFHEWGMAILEPSRAIGGDHPPRRRGSSVEGAAYMKHDVGSEVRGFAAPDPRPRLGGSSCRRLRWEREAWR